MTLRATNRGGAGRPVKETTPGTNLNESLGLALENKDSHQDSRTDTFRPYGDTQIFDLPLVGLAPADHPVTGPVLQIFPSQIGEFHGLP